MRIFKKNRVLLYESSIPVNKEVIKPSRNCIPKWYKESSKWSGSGVPQIYPVANPTLKLCVPFLEGLTQGYSLVLPCDVLVENKDGKPFMSWRIDTNVINYRERDALAQLPTPEGCYDIHYSWKVWSAFSVPKGYSVLFTHPLNRFDLPFLTMSGVIDGDFVFPDGSNVPFFLKENFEGIIPMGTPVATLIPFKPENWSSEYKEGLLKTGKENQIKTALKLFGWYKSTYWRKKYYE